MINLIIQFAIQVVLSYDLSLLSTPDGPRLSDRNTIRGDYGVPMPRVFGAATRVGGSVIASNGLIEHHHDVDTGWLGDVVDFLSPISALIPKPQVYTYSTTVALLVADRTSDGPIEGIAKIWANGKAIYEEGQTSSRFWKSLTVYPGSFTQTADPVLLGLGLIDGEAFRGSCYVVIEDLQLSEDFGNQLPTLEFLTRAKTGQTLAEMADIICAAAGIDAQHEMSSSQISDIIVGGYAIQQEVNCWDALKPLLPAFEVDAAEAAGQIRFFHRGHNMSAIIPADDMAGHVAEDERPEAYRLGHAPDINLPRQVDLTFRDPARDYQSNTQSARRVEGDATSNISAEFALTLSADDGRAMAQTLLWGPWTGRKTDDFAVTDHWIFTQPGQIYGLPTPAGTRPFRIARKTRGANGIIQLSCVADDGANYGSTGPGATGVVPANTSPVLAAPSTPTGLMVTGGEEAALLTWDANAQSEAISSYKIYRAPGAGSLFGAASLVETVTGTSWADSSLTGGASYTYFIEAVNSVGTSSPTAGQSAAVTGPVVAPSATITASAALAAGDLVNLHTVGGALRMRKADATDTTKPAHGFVKAAVLSAAAGDFFGPGAVNDAVSGLTPGATYWLSASTPGGVSSSAPSTSLNGDQEVGQALSATELLFVPKMMIEAP